MKNVKTGETELGGTDCPWLELEQDETKSLGLGVEKEAGREGRTLPRAPDVSLKCWEMDFILNARWEVSISMNIHRAKTFPKWSFVNVCSMSVSAYKWGNILVNIKETLKKLYFSLILLLGSELWALPLKNLNITDKFTKQLVHKCFKNRRKGSMVGTTISCLSPITNYLSGAPSFFFFEYWKTSSASPNFFFNIVDSITR